MHPSHQPDEKSILTIFAMKGGNKLKGLAKKRAVSGLARRHGGDLSPGPRPPPPFGAASLFHWPKNGRLPAGGAAGRF